MSNDGDGLIALLAVILAFLLIAAGIVAEAIVLRQLWEWFIAEPFGIRAISLRTAAGIALIASMLTYHSQNKSSSDSKEDPLANVVRLFVRTVLTPFFILFVGWLIYTMMGG